MARPIRIEYPGAIYHITSRGNNKLEDSQVTNSLSTYFKRHDKVQAMAEAYHSGGYSQREIGDYLGCHYSTVSRILKDAERQGKT